MFFLQAGQDSEGTVNVIYRSTSLCNISEGSLCNISEGPVYVIYRRVQFM